MNHLLIRLMSMEVIESPVAALKRPAITLLEDGSSPACDRLASTDENSSPAPNRTNNDSQSEKRQRELDESEKLAWELMREENEEAYRVQVEYLQNSQGNISAEDLLLLQSMMNEENQQHLAANTSPSEEEGQEEEQESWDYERLLELGEVLGDVKTERWRKRSQAVISQLNRFTLPSTYTSNSLSDMTGTQCPSDTQCVVCMEDFIADEMLIALPCRHTFHETCCSLWLAVS